MRMFAIVSLFGAVLSGAPATSPARAESGACPDTPAGRKLAGWLEAFNRRDREGLRRFNLANYAAPALEGLKRDGRTDIYWRLADHTGGFELGKVEAKSAHEVAAELKTKLTGEWARVEVAVDPAPPHGITRMTLGPIPGPSGTAAAQKMADADVAREVGALLDRLVAADEFSGVVIVAKGGRPIVARAVGMADQERKIPNRLDTRFSLASMGKMFTAVAVARLVERGKLSFDDTVGKHLPDYPNEDVARKVTIHQILTHTSGLGDFFNDRWKARKDSLRTVADYLALFADEPLKFAPGTKWDYSNAGFVVLGAIIERTTGRDYYEHVTADVFRPAGMIGAGFPAPGESPDTMATGYTREGTDGEPRPGPRRSNADHAPGRGNPAGGAWASAEDLLKFAEAMRSNALLSPKMTALVTGPRAETGQGPGERYGYGFMAHTVNGKRAFGHFGGFPGVSTALEVYPDLGYTVVVLSNYDMGAPRILMPIRGWIARD